MTELLKIAQRTILSSINRRILIAAGLIYFTIFMFGNLLDGGVWIFHHLAELADILFELVELSLDRLVEHLFDTGLHVTQTIVFYILLAIGAYAGYKLWKVVPHWYGWAVAKLTDLLTAQKTQTLDEWKSQSLSEKTNSLVLMAICCAGLYFMLFS
jgi:hypothetical protein